MIASLGGSPKDCIVHETEGEERDRRVGAFRSDGVYGGVGIQKTTALPGIGTLGEIREGIGSNELEQALRAQELSAIIIVDRALLRACSSADTLSRGASA